MENEEKIIEPEPVPIPFHGSSTVPTVPTVPTGVPRVNKFKLRAKLNRELI